MAFVDPNSYPVAGIVGEQIASVHDVFKPQKVAELYERFGSQFLPFFGELAAMGREEAVAGDEWFGHEDNWLHQTITVLGDTAEGAAGAAVQITLDPVSHNSLGQSYPRVGDVITLKDGSYSQARVEAKDISTPSAHKLTIKPFVSTKKIPAITDQTVLSITNGAFGAGTGQPDGANVGWTKRTFSAQILKETVGAEGSQLVNEKWYKVTDTGKNITSWYTPGTLQGEYRLDLKVDGAFLWGEEADNLTVPAGQPGAGNKVKTTKGLMRWITELGKGFEYTAEAYDPMDLDAIGLYLKSQGINAGYVLIKAGARLANDMENGMVEYLGANSAPDYTNAVKNVYKGNNDLAVAIGFSVIKKGGITFIIQPTAAWSNPMTFGAAGYDMDKYGVVLPLTKFIDPKTRATLNNIATRYRALGNYSRRMEVWNVNGAGPGLKVSEFDLVNTYLRKHVGLQVFKANQMGLLKPRA